MRTLFIQWFAALSHGQQSTAIAGGLLGALVFYSSVMAHVLMAGHQKWMEVRMEYLDWSERRVRRQRQGIGIGEPGDMKEEHNAR